MERPWQWKDHDRGTIGCAPTETQRLARKVYAALAEVDSALIGMHEIPSESMNLAQVIVERTAEIK